MNICVLGQGYVGLPISIHAAQVGYTVYGYDVNEDKVEELKKGITSSPDVEKQTILDLQSTKKLNFISELNQNLEVSIFVIAVPTPLNLNYEPDISKLKSACERIGAVIKPNSLVINESTSFIGTLRDFIKPLIDEKSKIAGIKYAVAPERIDPGNNKWTISNTPRVISGLSNEAIKEAGEFYEKFCSYVYPVPLPEIAEAAKLIENSFRQVNIALVNQLTDVAYEFNFSINDAINAAATKPFGFMPFYPSIGVGGHCIPVDPSYLIYSAKKVGYDAGLIEQANKINASMPELITTRIEKFFGKALPGKKIQVVGISYKLDIADVREAPALELIKILRSRGAIVTWCDPVVNEFWGETSTPIDDNIDLGLIVTPHSCIDLSVWKTSRVQVLDLSASPINYGWSKFL
jgi:UDP-N-acetyl-D-glucosamine dehydrogenase